jgi:hypothetical protein
MLSSVWAVMDRDVERIYTMIGRMRGKIVARSLLLGTAIILLLVASLWWRDHEAPLRTLEAARRAQPLSAISEPETGNARIVGSGVESWHRKLTPEEKATIERRVAAAKSILHQIELSKATAAEVTEVNRIRTDMVRVPALTVEDLQPVYDALSQAANEFEERSPAREAFRRSADALITRTRNRPIKVVFRVIDDNLRGIPNYKIANLSERAKATLIETGGLRIEGPNTIRIVRPGEESEAAEFFAELPESQ